MSHHRTSAVPYLHNSSNVQVSSKPQCETAVFVMAMHRSGWAVNPNCLVWTHPQTGLIQFAAASAEMLLINSLNTFFHHPSFLQPLLCILSFAIVVFTIRCLQPLHANSLGHTKLIHRNVLQGTRRKTNEPND